MDEILAKMHTLSRKRSLPVKFEEENAQRATRNRVSASLRSTSCCPNPECLNGGKMMVTRDGDYACNVCGACGPRVHISEAEWRVFADDADKQSKIRASSDNNRFVIETNIFAAKAKAAMMNERQTHFVNSFPYKDNQPKPIILPKQQSTSPTPPSPRSPLVTSNA